MIHEWSIYNATGTTGGCTGATNLGRVGGSKATILEEAASPISLLYIGFVPKLQSEPKHALRSIHGKGSSTRKRIDFLEKLIFVRPLNLWIPKGTGFQPTKTFQFNCTRLRKFPLSSLLPVISRSSGLFPSRPVMFLCAYRLHLHGYHAWISSCRFNQCPYCQCSRVFRFQFLATARHQDILSTAFPLPTVKLRPWRM